MKNDRACVTSPSPSVTFQTFLPFSSPMELIGAYGVHDSPNDRDPIIIGPSPDCFRDKRPNFPRDPGIYLCLQPTLRTQRGMISDARFIPFNQPGTFSGPIYVSFNIVPFLRNLVNCDLFSERDTVFLGCWIEHLLGGPANGSDCYPLRNLCACREMENPLNVIKTLLNGTNVVQISVEFRNGVRQTAFFIRRKTRFRHCSKLQNRNSDRCTALFRTTVVSSVN
jgi:hypothetical protein